MPFALEADKRVALAQWGVADAVMLDGERMWCESIGALVAPAVVLQDEAFDDRHLCRILLGDLFGVWIHSRFGVWLCDGRMIDALVLYRDRDRADAEWSKLYGHYRAHRILKGRGLLGE